MPENEPKQISRNIIYREVRRSIIMGHCRPGERLNVEELAHNYNTSVTPVRDALQMLNQEGLVTIKPRSGYFVNRMTLKELRDLLELRKLLELAAVERATTKITQEEIIELRNVHEGYTGDDDVSYDRYTDENRRFHYLIGQASGNHELATLVGHLHDRLARFMVLAHAGKTMLESHAEIVNALEAHKADEARQALLRDIDQTREVVLDQIIQTEAGSWHLDAYR
jgi:DNA-binding GntR family transcriptional regulator